MLSYTVTFPEFNVFLNTICLLKEHNHSSNSSFFSIPHFTPAWFVRNRNLARTDQYSDLDMGCKAEEVRLYSSYEQDIFFL
jgi:hypothetical protein